MFLFLKFQARAEEAKVAALSAVVSGKEVESEAITLHRELGSESASSLFILFTLFTVSVALLFSLKV